MNIDGLSLSPLIRELSMALAGGRIDKIFQPDTTTLVLWVRQPGISHRLVISINPSNPCMYLSTKTPQENPAVPPVFCMLLRKHLVDGRISSIRQHGLDRVATIDIDVRDEHGSIVTKNLIIELMGKHSNIIFSYNNLIIDSMKRVTAAMSRHRQILPGREYSSPPPQTGINILTTPAAAFTAELKSQTGPVHKAVIAAGIGLGPLTAREIVHRARLRADIKVEELAAADYDVISGVIDELAAQLTAGKTTPTVITDHDTLKAIAAFALTHLADFTCQQFSSMSAAVEYALELSPSIAAPAKEPLVKLVASEIARLERKQATLAEERAQALTADELRHKADILMANLYAIPANCQQITLPDLYSDEPEKNPVTITLDERLTPLENAQSHYARYNKLKRAQTTLAAQLAQCQDELTYLESVLVALEQAMNNGEVADIRQELINAGYIKEAKKRRPPAVSAPLSAVTSSGTPLLIGRNNMQNDYVTFKQARAADIWLHTKDIPGSHVILRTYAGEPSPQDIQEAAQLAAFFSKARHSANVPVDYTLRRFVKKPAGAKPGFVIYDHQSTMYVTPDKTLVKRLLEKQMKKNG